MKPNGDSKSVKEALEKICAHPLFANSTVYTRLLSYLVDKALQHEDIKEYSIGADLFGKDFVNDENNGSVRIYMYKLRKRLDAYYAETYPQHNIFFEIKKGQYNLHFISKKEYIKQNQNAAIRISFKQLKIAAIIFTLMLIALFGIKAIVNQPAALWKPFFERGSNSILVVSDSYVLMATNEHGEKHATIYSQIKDDADFFEFKKLHPDDKLETTDYTMLSKMAPYCTQNLTQWFVDNSSHFNLRLESELKLNDFKENNIVFIGQYTSMNISASFFLKSSKVFTNIKDGYKYKNEGVEILYSTTHQPGSKVEYAMVSYNKLSPGNVAIYFVSNHDIGVMATLRNFTDKNWLKTFYKQLPTKTAHFNALFKVSGIQRTDVSCELVELEVLED